MRGADWLAERDGLELHTVTFDPEVLQVCPGANADCRALAVRLQISSPVMPPQTVEISLKAPISAKFLLDGATEASEGCPVSIESQRIIRQDGSDHDTGRLLTEVLDSVHVADCHSARSPNAIKAPAHFCEQVFVTSRDGTRVPLTIASFARLSGAPGPCLLTVYGAYGMSLELGFEPERESLLWRGWSFACAVPTCLDTHNQTESVKQKV